MMQLNDTVIRDGRLLDTMVTFANLWIAFVSSSSSYSLWMTRRVVTKQRGAGHCSVFFTTYNLTRLQNNSEWFK